MSDQRTSDARTPGKGRDAHEDHHTSTVAAAAAAERRRAWATQDYPLPERPSPSDVEGL